MQFPTAIGNPVAQVRQAQWTNSEFAFVLFLFQIIALIPLSSYLTGLEWQVAITYMIIPMGFSLYSARTLTAVRSITVKDVLLYSQMAFWGTLPLVYGLYSVVLGVPMGTTGKDVLWGTIITQVLFVAPSEELAFRYIIPGWVSRMLGKDSFLLTAIITAGIFSFMHLSAYSANVTSLAIAFIVGLCWALVYRRFGIGATIGSHAAYNLLVAGILTGGVVGV